MLCDAVYALWACVWYTLANNVNKEREWDGEGGCKDCNLRRVSQALGVKRGYWLHCSTIPITDNQLN